MDQILVTKIITALVYPIGLVFVLALFALLARGLGLIKIATTSKYLSILILFLVSNPMVGQWTVSSLEGRYPQQSFDQIDKHDAVLVLGGGLRIPLPPALRTQIGHGSDRYWHAVQLYRAGKADKIVVAGGNVFEQAGFQGEAYYAAELLQEWGVPKDAIVIETSSRNTKENLANTANYFSSRGIESVLLVTSALHMPRAFSLFKQLPIKVTPASADVLVRKSSGPEIFRWLPSSGAIGLNTVAAHEYYGMWYNRLFN